MASYTDLTILLDRSGSMISMKEGMETALRSLIKTHKKVPSTHLSLIQFDDINDQEVLYLDRPIRECNKVSIHPRGNTPLIDAFVKTIDSTGERLRRMRESSRPDQVLFIVITDGLENASRTFKRHDLSQRISTQMGAYKWQFIYLGANQDAIREASHYNIPMGSSLSFLGENANFAVKSVSANTLAYAQSQGGLRGQSVNFFTPEDRENAVQTPQNQVETTPKDLFSHLPKKTLTTT